ncbi:MAG: Rrf2 family transcriptional regulator [Desulfobacteraceae bacterium]|nr:MAG: Rrf2 family transcriptional regulator [Desulfobacteraceae bacterium]
MFFPSKKGQYALRAVYELAKRTGQGPTKISAIAEAQSIPHRFLEVILHQLKGSGLVVSKRGFYGGYAIAKSPEEISVGDILRFFHKDQASTDCPACISRQSCPFVGNCAFSPLWKRVKAVAFQIYDGTTLRDLLNENESGLLPDARVEGRPAPSRTQAIR